MHLNLTADELLTTTRSVRKRLDFSRPVEDDVIRGATVTKDVPPYAVVAGCPAKVVGDVRNMSAAKKSQSVNSVAEEVVG